MRYCSNNLNMLTNQTHLVFLLQVPVTDIDMVVSDVIPLHPPISLY